MLISYQCIFKFLIHLTLDLTTYFIECERWKLSGTSIFCSVSYFLKLLTDFTFNSKVSYLREYNSKWLKTGATILQNIDFEISVVQLIEINTCNSL